MLTQLQWYERLVSWYPAWWVKPGGLFAAHLMALAKVLEAAGADVDAELAKTFVGTATADVLDTHAGERSVIRRDGPESDAALRVRIRNFALAVTQEDLVAAINTLLPVSTPAVFFDRMTYGPFLDSDEVFLDNSDALIMQNRSLYNFFYVHIPALAPTTVLASDTVIGVGETTTYVYLHVPAGITLTVNGTLKYTKLLNEGTIIYGPNSGVDAIPATDFYDLIDEQIRVVKAFGVDYTIWSEAFYL